MLTSGPLHGWPLGPEHLSPSLSPQPIHPHDCQLCLLNVPLPVPAAQTPPSPRLSPESSPHSGEAGEDSGPHFTGEKIETQRERPEVRPGEALRSPPPPAPLHQGKGISFCSGGCGVLGQLVGRLTGLGACVCGSGSWGSRGPTPTRSASGRWGRGAAAGAWPCAS